MCALQSAQAKAGDHIQGIIAYLASLKMVITTSSDHGSVIGAQVGRRMIFHPLLLIRDLCFANQDNLVQVRHSNLATINSLIADLGSKDTPVRIKARQYLVAIGEPAVSPLVEALAHRNQWVRWDTAKSLGQIDSPAAAQALVRALEDDMFDVRWLAAKGLLTVGRDALVPLLHALLERSDSELLREGAHHIFHDLARGAL